MPYLSLINQIADPRMLAETLDKVVGTLGANRKIVEECIKEG